MLIDPVSVAKPAPDTRGLPAPAAHAAAAMPAAGIDEAQLKALVRDVNRTLAPLASSIEFTVDQKSGKTVVKVVDKETQQLIRQIPSLEMLEIAHAVDRMQSLLLKEKV
jgi:flagellar protein FlaG